MSPIQLTAYGNISAKFYTNNQFKQLAAQINLVVPSVVTGTTAIPTITYWITDPIQGTPVIPNPAYTENVTTTYPGLVGDARIVIQYKVTLNDGSTPTWWSYNPSTLTGSIYTIDNSVEGTYTK